MTTENLEQNKGSLVTMSKVVGATTAMLSGLEAGVASRAAENAVENNLLPLLAVAGSGIATLGGGAATIGIGTQTAIAVGAGILTAVGLNALVNKDGEGETQSTNTTAGAANSGGGMPGDEGPEKNKTNQTSDQSQGKQRPNMGEYRSTKGHHVHAKKAFEGHPNYDPNTAFSISNEFMEAAEIEHRRITSSQQRLFIELAKSGKPNTMSEHTRIAVESLVNGGASRQEARKIVAQSLRDLRNKGVKTPTNIPWGN